MLKLARTLANIAVGEDIGLAIQPKPSCIDLGEICQVIGSEWYKYTR
jgi:hypothetical protein